MYGSEYQEMEAMAQQLHAPAMKLAALMAQAMLRSIPAQSLDKIGNKVKQQKQKGRNVQSGDDDEPEGCVSHKQFQ